MLRQNILTQKKKSKHTIEFVLCWLWSLLLMVFCTSSESLLEKTNFSFASVCQLKRASELGMGVSSTSPLSSRTPMGPDLCRSCACCHSLLEFLHMSTLLCLGGFVCLVPFIPSGAYNLSTPFPQGSLSPEKRDLMETAHLGLSAFRVPPSIYIVQLWVSVSYITF